MRSFTADECRTIVELFNAGIPISDIKRQLSAGDRSIRRVIRELSLTRTKQIRNPPSPDLIGTKFEYATITGFVYHDKSRQWHMVCDCVCSKSFHDTLKKLKTGERKTCGTSDCSAFHEVRVRNGRQAGFTGHEEIYGSRWMGWVCGAKARDIEFAVTPEEAWTKFLQQERKCALSGVELSFGTAWNRNGTASLDRIDSNRGYLLDNIQWVHKQINVMKRACSDEEFINWCRLVVLHRGTSTNER